MLFLSDITRIVNKQPLVAVIHVAVHEQLFAGRRLQTLFSRWHLRSFDLSSNC